MTGVLGADDGLCCYQSQVATPTSSICFRVFKSGNNADGDSPTSTDVQEQQFILRQGVKMQSPSPAHVFVEPFSCNYFDGNSLPIR